VLLAVVLLAMLYCYGITSVGMLGPDEPRYAAIGRAMAQSGDWVTPRLWGQPWFEKPPLLYWMTAAATRAGFSQDAAPRIPVAVTAIVFLIFFYFRVQKLFDEPVARYAAALLATSAGWLAYGFVAVTDLPMSATLCAALLLCLGEQPRAVWAGILLGLAVLAKGLVPLVLFVPVIWWLRRRWRDLARVAVACLAIAAPWYALCTARNGTAFLTDFFWKHHFERFSSDVLAHGRPFWFFVPVLLAGLFPWTPMLGLLGRHEVWKDTRLRFLVIWAAFGFVFFSASYNKLPGYVLPLLPALCVAMGAALARMQQARWWLLASGLLLILLPVIAVILPRALIEGLSRAQVSAVPWGVALPFVVAAAGCWWLEGLGRREAALVILTFAIGGGVMWLKLFTFPRLDALVSARHLWWRIAPEADAICLDDIRRDWVYGLDYYAGRALPLCNEHPMPVRFHAGPITARR